MKSLNNESNRSHFATLKTGRGKYRKYSPYAFTEQDVAMLSTVLNSEMYLINQLFQKTIGSGS
jgi:hypothetical protein